MVLKSLCMDVKDRKCYMSMSVFVSILLLLTSSAMGNLLSDMESPILLQGDDLVAYRDPTAIYHDGVFYLYCTMVRTEELNYIYSYTVMSQSTNLRDWSEPVIITPKGQDLNYCSPGNVIWYGNEWILCLQSYPRLDYQRGDDLRFGDSNARVFIMRSPDLINWSSPELLMVKGPTVPVEDMGRMIDAYLVEDKDLPGKWWCFYKQNGVSMSWSYDLQNWTFHGYTDSGENVCVLTENDEYILMHSPSNGLAIKRSPNLISWQDDPGLITLGQDQWDWVGNRLTAGFVLDMRDNPQIGKYLLFFHGSGPGVVSTQDNKDANCTVGLAWNDTMTIDGWNWPGKPLSIITSPVGIAEDAVFSVDLSDLNGVSSVMWRRAEPTPDIALYNDGKYLATTDATSSVLIVTDVQYEDVGQYYCVVNASEGPVISPTAALELKRQVAHYEFEIDPTLGVFDSSNESNHGIAVGDTSLVVGKIGNALEFDGDDYIIIPRSIGDDFTITVWVKTTHDTAETYWYKGDAIVNGEMPNTVNDFGLQMTDGGHVNAAVRERWDRALSNTEINDGQWHFVCMTRDKSTGEIKVFVDGLEEGAVIGTTATLDAPSVLAIGRQLTGTGYWVGNIDDVKLYNYVLTNPEIQNAYADGQEIICLGDIPGDLNDDCMVNFIDLAIIAGSWLDCNLYPVCY